MNYGEGALSASDVALLTGNSGNNGGFGEGNGAWWIILFLIFAFGAFGRNGFGGGGYGGGGGGIGENYVLATDFATIERKLDSVNSGICDATFALNNTMTNGFAGVQQTLCQGFNGLNTSIFQSGFNTERGLWNLSSQFADCCCKTQRAIDGVNYNMAMNTNAIQQTLCNTTRDIIENQNANYRAIHEELVANKLEMKNERISEQQNEIYALRLAASQERQNGVIRAAIDASEANIIRRTGNDCPVPAYVVQPSTPVSFPTNCCGQFTGFNNNGCGCGAY